MVNKYEVNLFKARMKARRDFLNISMDDFGSMLNVTRQTVSKWENEKEKSSPTIRDMLKICNILGCDLGYLLGEYDTLHRKTFDICTETGITEAAADLLLEAADLYYEALENHADEYILNSPHDSLQHFEIGKYAKIKFLSSLLENYELWEEIAVSAYFYIVHMRKYQACPSDTIEGITRDQFANAAKENAKEALGKLFAGLDWDITEWNPQE